MSANSAIAHYTAHIPPAAPATPVAATTHVAAKTDGDGDLGIEAGGSGQTVNSHLSHAVQQALGHLPVHAQAASTADSSSVSTASASGQVLPMTMEGFIRALIASLHQIGTTASGSPLQNAGVQAISANSGGYAPAPANDVQTLIRQSATVLSSNTVLQQDFQSMLRAAGIDQSATSLQHFLRSVSTQMKPSSVVDAIA